MTSQEFRIDCKNWLYTYANDSVIYSANHPTDTKDNIDFIINGIRVRCYLTETGIHYQLYMDLFSSITLQSHIFFNKEELLPKLKQFKRYIYILRLYTKLQKIWKI